jgi:hypothetical protein
MLVASKVGAGRAPGEVAVDSIVHTGALREIVVVLVLALAGVALVSLIAFAPWLPGEAAGSAGPVVVEVYQPTGTDVANAVSVSWAY